MRFWSFRRLSKVLAFLTATLLAVLSLLAVAPAYADTCSQWDVSGQWSITQNNDYRPIFNLTQNGSYLSGTAVYAGNDRYPPASGELDGRILDDQLDVTVNWSNGVVERYLAIVTQNTLAGYGYLDEDPSQRIIWSGTGRAVCISAPPAATGTAAPAATPTVTVAANSTVTPPATPSGTVIATSTMTPWATPTGTEIADSTVTPPATPSGTVIATPTATTSADTTAITAATTTSIPTSAPSLTGREAEIALEKALAEISSIGDLRNWVDSRTDNDKSKYASSDANDAFDEFTRVAANRPGASSENIERAASVFRTIAYFAGLIDGSGNPLFPTFRSRGVFRVLTTMAFAAGDDPQKLTAFKHLVSMLVSQDMQRYEKPK